MKNDFTAALLKEIRLRADYLEGEPVETIYFGGGTPSLLPAADIGHILEGIRQSFTLPDDPEITLEANPDDVSLPVLQHWKSAGINRLSLGVQSFHGGDLEWMHRAHDEKQAYRSITDAQSAGLLNISIDLIYGLPGMPDQRWKENISAAVSLGIPHLSCYALTVEPKTVLQKKIRQGILPDTIPEDQARQFLEGIQWLEDFGYEQYEISNFAQAGKRSRHNSAYWQSKKYLGLGPSAHSFNGFSRQWNVANNALYIQGLNRDMPAFEMEILQAADRLNEYVMTSLRTSEGLDLAYVSDAFGPGNRERLEAAASRHIGAGHILANGNRLVLTRNGKLFADGIAGSLFIDNEAGGKK